ncbi:MAG: hypothetical protein LBE33_09965 [Zoogloeaceae bacterium]|nr:hypothetical protein [Zoogloeaceae bacterium]
MNEIDHATGLARPPQGLMMLAHVIYGLHAFSAVTGLVSAAFVVTAFLTGWPSIIAVVLNYIKRGETYGTWLESHFRWQIRTFWFALQWLALAILLMMTVIGLPLAYAVAVGAGLWVLYRIVAGWLRLVSEKPMPL